MRSKPYGQRTHYAYVEAWWYGGRYVDVRQAQTVKKTIPHSQVGKQPSGDWWDTHSITLTYHGPIGSTYA